MKKGIAIVLLLVGIVGLYRSYSAIYLSGESVGVVNVQASGDASTTVELDPEMNPLRGVVSLSYETFRKLKNHNKDLVSWEVQITSPTGDSVVFDSQLQQATKQEIDKNLSSFHSSLSTRTELFEVSQSGSHQVRIRSKEFNARYKSLSVDIRKNVEPLSYPVLAVGVLGLFAGMGLLFYRKAN